MKKILKFLARRRYLKRIAWFKRNKNYVSAPENIDCPVCGYYCLGNGGFGCIDKPMLCGYPSISSNTVPFAAPGRERLWQWFGLSRASWLTMPRVLMHEMPEEWQGKMADLLHEFDETWDSGDMPAPYVSARKGNRFTKWPGWILDYRHPNKDEIEKVRSR